MDDNASIIYQYAESETNALDKLFDFIFEKLEQS